MVKHAQTVRRLLPTNCLSVFEHFMGLALKGLTTYFLLDKCSFNPKFFFKSKNSLINIKLTAILTSLSCKSACTTPKKSKMDNFATIVNSWNPLTKVIKRPIIDVTGVLDRLLFFVCNHKGPQQPGLYLTASTVTLQNRVKHQRRNFLISKHHLKCLNTF